MVEAQVMVSAKNHPVALENTHILVIGSKMAEGGRIQVSNGSSDTYMVQDSGFRNEVSINKGLGVVRGNDADGAVDVGYNTKIKQKRLTWQDSQ